MNNFYNAQIKCVSSSREDLFKVGKTYEVKDGTFEDEKGFVINKRSVGIFFNGTSDKRFNSLLEINNRMKISNSFYFIFEETSSNSKHSIHITTDGTTTTCVMKDSNGVIKRTQAKCNPHDTFDFETGARIAFDRCCTNLAESSAFTKVKEVKRQAEVGECIKIVNPYYTPLFTKQDYVKDDVFIVIDIYEDGIIILGKRNKEVKVLNEEYFVLEEYVPPTAEPKFIPHLKYDCEAGDDCGNIGEETIQTAFGGEKLFVGDVVNVYNTQSKIDFGNCIVAKCDKYPKGFVMGNASDIFKNGVCCDWKIRKVRSFEELKDGEVIGSVKVVLTDEDK